MHRLIFYMIVVLGLSSQAFSAETQNKNTERPSSVNPLELKRGWWEFFDVPVEQIPTQIEEFKKELQSLTSKLTSEEHNEILALIDHIYLQLDIYLKERKDTFSSRKTDLQFKKRYNMGELIQVNTKLTQSHAKIKQLKEGKEVLRSNIATIVDQLDKLILEYQAIPESTHDRLMKGLEIIEKKTQLSNKRIQSSSAGDEIDFFLKEKEHLTNELSFAKEHLFFEPNQKNILKDQWNLSEKAYRSASNKIHEIQKNAFYKDQEALDDELICCLWDYRLLTQTIRTETLSLKSLTDEIKYTLWLIANVPETIETETIQDFVSTWKKKLAETTSHNNQWRTQIQREHAKVRQLISKLSSDEDNMISLDQGIIPIIHTELDHSFGLLDELSRLIPNGELLIQQSSNYLVKEKTITEIWWILIQNELNSYLDTLSSWMTITFFRIGDHPVTLYSLLKALAIFITALLISKYLKKRIAQRKIFKSSVNRSTEYIISQLVHYLVIVLGTLFALISLGINFTNIAIIAGALGVGIGFGLQSIVNNILSGFMLLFQRIIKIGDMVELGDKTLGKVSGINLQNTNVRTFDGGDLLIPNSILMSQKLTNWTMHDWYRRFKIPFGVAYGTDKEYVSKVILEAVKEFPFVVSGSPRYNDPQLWMTGFGDSSIDFELVVWVDMNVSIPTGIAKSRLLWVIDDLLVKHGIQVPFPQRDLHIIKERPKA